MCAIAHTYFPIHIFQAFYDTERSYSHLFHYSAFLEDLPYAQVSITRYSYEDYLNLNAKFLPLKISYSSLYVIIKLVS